MKYKDLPAKQKKNIINQAVIFGLIMVTLNIIFFGLAFNYLDQQISSSDDPMTQLGNIMSGLIILMAIGMGGTSYALVCITGDIFGFIKSKSKLYTDIDLEKAEKDLARIKTALGKN